MGNGAAPVFSSCVDRADVGQRARFSLFAPGKLPYAARRHEDEGTRIERVLEKLLDGRNHLPGSVTDPLSAVVSPFRCRHRISRRSCQPLIET